MWTRLDKKNYEDTKKKLFKTRTNRWETSTYSIFDLNSEFQRSINEHVHEISTCY